MFTHKKYIAQRPNFLTNHNRKLLFRYSKPSVKQEIGFYSHQSVKDKPFTSYTQKLKSNTSENIKKSLKNPLHEF